MVNYLYGNVDHQLSRNMLVLTAMTILKKFFSQGVIIIWKGGIHKDIFVNVASFQNLSDFLICQK